MVGGKFLLNGDAPGRATVLLAHGAGAAMDSPWMQAVTAGLAARGMRVARFEFAYMAARRCGGAKRPPPKVEILTEEYRNAVAALPHDGPLILAGKSMGGRVASLIADDMGRAVAGLLCFGYPFHPQRKPAVLRTAHLEGLRTPTLICQGSRDPFGTQEEIAGYTLSEQITIQWLADGDHDFKPRRRLTGLTQEDHIATACAAAADWLATLARG